MNLKDTLHSIIAKDNGDTDYAVIFKNYEEEDTSIAYLPVGIIKGKLDEENLSFTSNNITFNHLIKGPKEYGFAFAKTLTETIKNSKVVLSFIQKKSMLKSLQRYYYIYANDENNHPVVGVQSVNDDKDIDILYEEELLNYYIKKFPTAKDIINLLKKASGKLNLDIKEISSTLEETYSNKEQSQQILTSIWKHYHSDRPYHIFINGSEISPKKEIVKSICEGANIPYHFVSAIQNYEVIDLDEVLKKLLELSGNDQELAENSLLIIDDIDKLALDNLETESFANAQYNLAKILKGDTILLKYGKHKKVSFDTSKMMIIGMGNFKDDEIKDIKVKGFSRVLESNKKSKEKYKYGMLDGLFDNFNMIIQMEDPNLQDYQNYLANRETAGILNNIEFFNNMNIKLTWSDETISSLASLAYKEKMSLYDIRELIEHMLAKASLEVAKNPEEYEELIITPDTIKNNNIYTPIKKKSK